MLHVISGFATDLTCSPRDALLSVFIFGAGNPLLEPADSWCYCQRLASSWGEGGENIFCRK